VALVVEIVVEDVRIGEAGAVKAGDHAGIGATGDCGDIFGVERHSHVNLAQSSVVREMASSARLLLKLFAPRDDETDGRRGRRSGFVGSWTLPARRRLDGHIADVMRPSWRGWNGFAAYSATWPVDMIPIFPMMRG